MGRMSELDIFNMYRQQIIELIVVCRGMNREQYENWKVKTMKETPEKAAGFMKKVLIIVSAFGKENDE